MRILFHNDRGKALVLTTNVDVRIGDELKANVATSLEEVGLNISDGITIYVNKIKL